MDEPKPVASLGPTLLARKGGARPAMRPQLAGVLPMGGGTAAQALANDLDDLGWNDMGDDDAPVERMAEVLQLTPASAPEPKGRPEKIKPASKVEAALDKGSPRRTVKTMHEELAERIVQEAEAARTATDTPAIPLRKREAPIRAVPAPAPEIAESEVVDFAERPVASRRKRVRTETEADTDGRRAAFTLRLDAKRHLKLRLASTVRNRSAQQLVTEALDRFLRDIPEIELLARQVRRD